MLPTPAKQQELLPTRAKQQEQLFQLLNGMRSAEHESFLGHWLYPLIEVHHTYSYSAIYCMFIHAKHRDGMPPTRLWYRRWIRRRASERSPA